MTEVAFLYDDIFLAHEMPPMHPESPERLRACLTAVREGGLWDSLFHGTVRKGTPGEMALAHSEEYVERVRTFGSGYLDPDTYLSPMTYEAALAAAGAVMTAVDLCREGEKRRAFCAVRPPGHHAEHDRAMGFCVFNNVAVGARYAGTRGFDRVMIADFDVHHGNGTQNIFYEDDGVFFFSTHQYPHYPGTGAAGERGRGRGEGYTRNIPLPGGAGDTELLRAYREEFPALVGDFDPELIIVSAGYDLHGSDPLAGFTVTDEGVAGVVEGILDAAGERPVVFSLEGGYDLRSLSRLVALTLEKLLSYP
jgi:acetoin utilization deacetylase AcuC-like enzyme